MTADNSRDHGGKVIMLASRDRDRYDVSGCSHSAVV